jgi:hypothetical protein
MKLGNSGICEEDALAVHGNLECQHGNTSEVNPE